MEVSKIVGVCEGLGCCHTVWSVVEQGGKRMWAVDSDLKWSAVERSGELEVNAEAQGRIGKCWQLAAAAGKVSSVDVCVRWRGALVRWNGTGETYAEGINVKETAGEQWRTREGEGDHIGEGIGWAAKIVLVETFNKTLVSYYVPSYVVRTSFRCHNNVWLRENIDVPGTLNYELRK